MTKEIVNNAGLGIGIIIGIIALLWALWVLGSDGHDDDTKGCAIVILFMAIAIVVVLLFTKGLDWYKSLPDSAPTAAQSVGLFYLVRLIRGKRHFMAHYNKVAVHWIEEDSAPVHALPRCFAPGSMLK